MGAFVFEKQRATSAERGPERERSEQVERAARMKHTFSASKSHYARISPSVFVSDEDTSLVRGRLMKKAPFMRLLIRMFTVGGDH